MCYMSRTGVSADPWSSEGSPWNHKSSLGILTAAHERRSLTCKMKKKRKLIYFRPSAWCKREGKFLRKTRCEKKEKSAEIYSLSRCGKGENRRAVGEAAEGPGFPCCRKGEERPAAGGPAEGSGFLCCGEGEERQAAG